MAKESNGIRPGRGRQTWNVHISAGSRARRLCWRWTGRCLEVSEGRLLLLWGSDWFARERVISRDSVVKSVGFLLVRQAGWDRLVLMRSSWRNESDQVRFEKVDLVKIGHLKIVAFFYFLGWRYIVECYSWPGTSLRQIEPEMRKLHFDWQWFGSNSAKSKVAPFAQFLLWIGSSGSALMV